MIRLNALQASSDFKSLRERLEIPTKTKQTEKGHWTQICQICKLGFICCLQMKLVVTIVTPAICIPGTVGYFLALFWRKKETGITRNKHKNITKTSKTFCSYFREWITDQIVPHHYIIFRDYCTLGQKI